MIYERKTDRVYGLAVRRLRHWIKSHGTFTVREMVTDGVFASTPAASSMVHRLAVRGEVRMATPPTGSHKTWVPAVWERTQLFGRLRPRRLRRRSRVQSGLPAHS